MNSLKKFIFLILIPVTFATFMMGCATEAKKSTTASSFTSGSDATNANVSENVPGTPEADPVTIRLGGLRGATSMGMVKLLKDAQQGNSFNAYEFSLSGSADEVTPKLISGELDIAAVPANLASVLYNNTGGKVRLLAINTLGVLYIVETGEAIESLADLMGKTIYATGRGSTPEFTLNYLLRENGLDPDKDLNIEWKTEPAEVVSLMAQRQGIIAMMPQPYVTVAQGTIDNLRIAIDLTYEWDALGNSGMLLTGVLVVRSDFADKYPDQIAVFLEEYEKSTEYVNSNISEASILIEEFDIVKAAVAEKALPYCNITFYAGADMKTAMQGYLRVLYEQNPQSIGGTLPDDNFYYGA